jgi:hypothetical protein
VPPSVDPTLPLSDLPSDVEIEALTNEADSRHAPGTSLEARLQTPVALHLRICDLDFSELPIYLNSVNQNFLPTFSTRRQNAISNLLTLIEARISRLRSSISIHSTPSIAVLPAPATSQSSMYKGLNGLKNYPRSHHI